MANGSCAATSAASFNANAPAPIDVAGARIKQIAVAFTGNYGPTGGETLDLSALFPNKVIAVMLSAAIKADDKTLAYPCYYIPGSTPANGKVACYNGDQNNAADGPLIEMPADATSLTGYTAYGYAIGY